MYQHVEYEYIKTIADTKVFFSIIMR